MTTAQFTPGPWTVAADMRGLGNVPVAGVETSAGLAIANCGTHGEANARLIASAPDLLRVLTMYLNVDDDGDGFICAEAMDEVRAIIDRATGAA